MSTNLIDTSQAAPGAQHADTAAKSNGRVHPDVPSDRELIEADIVEFERKLAAYRSGEMEEEVFRVVRLSMGIYGQRQGAENHMVRVKVPYGSLGSQQLRALGDIVDRYSRGWGHITTRQNLQFHYAQLSDIPEILRALGSAGLTTREACGDTVRNVQGCHLAGACPYEKFDISAWAEATHQHFVRNPIAQRMPRKFKINFSGCETDCGQAMFNDAGVVAVKRTAADSSTEYGFRVYIAGGLGTTPSAAIALEEFTAKEELLPTLEALLRVFDQAGNRENKLRARMKWLVTTLGIDEVRRRIFASRRLLVAAANYPYGIPEEVVRMGDAPAGAGSGPITEMGHGTAVTIRKGDGFSKWSSTNVVRGAANGTVSAYAHARLGDVTGDQFRRLADLVDRVGAQVRVTNRQNFVLRGLGEDDLQTVYDALVDIDMAAPGAELIRDVVSCPGADTCNLAVTQSRGLADAITAALESEGLAETGGLRINISGCPNSCGQHHVADIGFFGTERRAFGRSAPGYTMLMGGHLGQEEVHFGDKALRLPAKNVPSAVTRVVGSFVEKREAGQSFRSWLESSGGVSQLASDLKVLDEFPDPSVDESFFVDYDETGPFEVNVGESECAT